MCITRLSFDCWRRSSGCCYSMSDSSPYPCYWRFARNERFRSLYPVDIDLRLYARSRSYLSRTAYITRISRLGKHGEKRRSSHLFRHCIRYLYGSRNSGLRDRTLWSKGYILLLNIHAAWNVPLPSRSKESCHRERMSGKSQTLLLSEWKAYW